ncbi:MAG: hypothetical protein ABI553_06270, partial [Chloroflexota bacterium]
MAARTEGWAASLQLVQAALRDRSPAEIRRFVRGLSGADQELYDYLAEEVVGDLPEDLQQFLMRTSILQGVTPEMASVVADADPAETTRLTLAAERLTLLTRPSRSSRGPQRYHPLVREFLEARLRATTGEPAVARLHRTAAEAAARTDWRTAAHHYREAGDLDCVATVVAAAIPEIMGSGQYAVAVGYIDLIPLETRPAGLNLIKSRIDMQEGAHESAIALSRAVLNDVEPGSQESDHALLNLATMFMHAGETEEALRHLDRLRASSVNQRLHVLAAGMQLLIAASGKGSLDALAKHLTSTAHRYRGTQPHYYGVAMLNLAVTSIIQDNPGLAIEHATHAIEALRETSSRIEMSSAVMAKATALMMLGQTEEAEQESERASAFGQVEAALERADFEDSYGNPEGAWPILDSVEGSRDLNLNDHLALSLQLSRYLSRRQSHEQALARIIEIDPALTGVVPGQTTAVLATSAYVAVAAGAEDGAVKALEASRWAKSQGAERWRRVSELMRASRGSADEFANVISWVGSSPWNLTFVADLIARRLDE